MILLSLLLLLLAAAAVADSGHPAAVPAFPAADPFNHIADPANAIAAAVTPTTSTCFFIQDLGPLSPLELLDLEACLQASLNRVATGRQSAVSRYKSRQQAEGTMHPGNNGSRGAQPALP